MNRSSTITTLRTYCQRLRAAAFALLCTALMASGALAQTVTYFHNDIAGTPQLATNASGAVVWKENYLPYGQRQVAEPASAGNRLWYTGKPHDVDTGLTYLGARYCMPTLGRFTGIDPKAFSPEQPHSLNRYAYGNNNPYKYVDPDGRSPVDVGFLVCDTIKPGLALYSGVGVGHAAADVAISTVGVLSPIPGTGQAIKGLRAAEHVAEAARGVARGGESVAAAKGRQAHKELAERVSQKLGGSPNRGSSAPTARSTSQTL